ncbi:ligand-gated sodium channel [Desmophyllum pertusum]|uniref:Ligand-gated sodium channel n=1 Tax=Desmophyllum pertusum TaxID=174260 RepID=A0A9W9ZR56_9CNID|nr:ligand-gated sodium channel [Desmophyllum pertusum]
MATVEEDDDRLSDSFLFYDFLGYTSMHGAGRIVVSRQWIRKVFWIILIMAALGVSSWQFTFSVITICDMNALRKDELENFAGGESLRREVEERSPLNSSSDQEPPPPPQVSVDPLENFAEENEGGAEGGGEGSVEQVEEGFKDRELLRTKIAEQNVEDLIRIGHQFEDFVVYCTFRGVYCANYSSTFWNRFWHYTYGNCYVFNGGAKEQGKKAKILSSNEPGPSHGLSLELNIEQDQYIGALTQEAGVELTSQIREKCHFLKTRDSALHQDMQHQLECERLLSIGGIRFQKIFA